MDSGRRHETLGSESKDFITHISSSNWNLNLSQLPKPQFPQNNTGGAGDSCTCGGLHCGRETSRIGILTLILGSKHAWTCHRRIHSLITLGYKQTSLCSRGRHQVYLPRFYVQASMRRYSWMKAISTCVDKKYSNTETMENCLPTPIHINIPAHRDLI